MEVEYNAFEQRLHYSALPLQSATSFIGMLALRGGPSGTLCGSEYSQPLVCVIRTGIIYHIVHNDAALSLLLTATVGFRVSVDTVDR